MRPTPPGAFSTKACSDVGAYLIYVTMQLTLVKLNKFPASNDNRIKGWTPLHYATCENNTNKVKQLIDTGSDVDAPDGWKHTPLHIAAEFNAPEVAELLFKNGADLCAITPQGDTALHWAARHNAVQVAKLLIHAGIDVSERGRFNLTPLHWALEFDSSPDVARVLIENGADIHSTNISTWVSGGWTPLHVAAIWNVFGMIPLLIEKGADVHARDHSDNTVLHDVASTSSIESAAILLQTVEHHDCVFRTSLDIHAKNKDGETPLMRTKIACTDTVKDRSRKSSMIQLLQTYGARE